MKKISWNWIRGGMAGSLRFALHNVRRVTDVFAPSNKEISDLAFSIERDIDRLMNLVLAAEDPRRHD